MHLIFWVWGASTYVCLLAAKVQTELFQTNASSLFKMCLEVSSRNLSEVSYTEEYIKSEYFLGFLSNLNIALGKNSLIPIWTNWRNWATHYEERDNAENHPVCTAAAFSYVPFSLRNIKRTNHDTSGQLHERRILALNCSR